MAALIILPTETESCRNNVVSSLEDSKIPFL